MKILFILAFTLLVSTPVYADLAGDVAKKAAAVAKGSKELGWNIERYNALIDHNLEMKADTEEMRKQDLNNANVYTLGAIFRNHEQIEINRGIANHLDDWIDKAEVDLDKCKKELAALKARLKSETGEGYDTNADLPAQVEDIKKKLDDKAEKLGEIKQRREENKGVWKDLDQFIADTKHLLKGVDPKTLKDIQKKEAPKDRSHHKK